MTDNLTFLDQSEAQRVCERWQKILRLQDWNVFTRICRERDMSGLGRHAEIYLIPKLKGARITFMSHLDFPDTSWVPQDDEQKAVHELLHLGIESFFPQDLEGRSEVEEVGYEQHVELTSVALITLDRSARGVPDLTYYRQEVSDGSHD